MPDRPPPPSPATPADGNPLELLSSVAGEEDPGASIDLALPPGSGRPQDEGSNRAAGDQTAISPAPRGQRPDAQVIVAASGAGQDGGEREAPGAGAGGAQGRGASASGGAGERRPGASDQPAGNRPTGSPGDQPRMSPGDEAPPGTPGTGEDVCRRCGGSGRSEGQACPECGGTGTVTVGIGGA